MLACKSVPETVKLCSELLDDAHDVKALNVPEVVMVGVPPKVTVSASEF